MLAVARGGFAAGGINAVVGSGTLVTFPVLLAVGLLPVAATITNSLGLVVGQPRRIHRLPPRTARPARLLLRLLPASILGALTGAFLLLDLPASTFEAVVPALIALAVVLVATQPLLQRALARRRAAGDGEAAPVASDRGGWPASSPGPMPPAPTGATSQRARGPADRHLRAAAPRVAAATECHQERAHHGGQRRRSPRLRDRRDRPVTGRRPGWSPRARWRAASSAPRSAGGCPRWSCGRRSSSSASRRSSC